jgi:uncharacterized protein with GYD domain
LVEKAGGKLIGGYYTFGEYDVVIIIEAPNDEAVMSLMLKVGSALEWLYWLLHSVLLLTNRKHT